jgi:hypothetical protein
VTSEVAPAASGRLSVANPLSGRRPCLIHHPSAVDWPTSLTTGLQDEALTRQILFVVLGGGIGANGNPVAWRTRCEALSA